MCRAWHVQLHPRKYTITIPLLCQLRKFMHGGNILTLANYNSLCMLDSYAVIIPWSHHIHSFSYIISSIDTNEVSSMVSNSVHGSEWTDPPSTNLNVTFFFSAVCVHRWQVNNLRVYIATHESWPYQLAQLTEATALLALFLRGLDSISMSIVVHLHQGPISHIADPFYSAQWRLYLHPMPALFSIMPHHQEYITRSMLHT